MQKSTVGLSEYTAYLHAKFTVGLLQLKLKTDGFCVLAGQLLKAAGDIGALLAEEESIGGAPGVSVFGEPVVGESEIVKGFGLTLRALDSGKRGAELGIGV